MEGRAFLCWAALAAAAPLAAVPAARIDEIAAWLPERPAADGAAGRFTPRRTRAST